MTQHTVGSREQWLAARLPLLEREKALTRMSDEIAAERRALPWVPVEKTYTFDTPAGPRTLAELFEGRSQLVVQHFMFGPDDEVGCKGCSSVADHSEGSYRHLQGNGVSFVAISRAPLAKLEEYRRRMGWTFPWVSSYESDFNYDFEATTPEGREVTRMSAFALLAGVVHHTYSTQRRGVEAFWGVYGWLDRAPLGRSEEGGRDWLRRHDEYEVAVA